MDDQAALEMLVRDVFAECTIAFIGEVSRRGRYGQEKEVTREGLRRWRLEFDNTVGARLREVAGPEFDWRAAEAEWESETEGRGYVLAHVAKMAGQAFRAAAYGDIDEYDIGDAVIRVKERVDRRHERIDARGAELVPVKKWCA